MCTINPQRRYGWKTKYARNLFNFILFIYFWDILINDCIEINSNYGWFITVFRPQCSKMRESRILLGFTHLLHSPGNEKFCWLKSIRNVERKQEMKSNRVTVRSIFLGLINFFHPLHIKSHFMHSLYIFSRWKPIFCGCSLARSLTRLFTYSLTFATRLFVVMTTTTTMWTNSRCCWTKVNDETAN